MTSDDPRLHMSASADSETQLEYGCAFDLGGETHFQAVGSLVNTHRRMANLIRHHIGHDVKAENYRIVCRTLQIGPWVSP